jgi:hypothetical protein
MVCWAQALFAARSPVFERLLYPATEANAIVAVRSPFQPHSLHPSFLIPLPWFAAAGCVSRCVSVCERHCVLRPRAAQRRLCARHSTSRQAMYVRCNQCKPFVWRWVCDAQSVWCCVVVLHR